MEKTSRSPNRAYLPCFSYRRGRWSRNIAVHRSGFGFYARGCATSSSSGGCRYCFRSHEIGGQRGETEKAETPAPSSAREEREEEGSVQETG